MIGKDASVSIQRGESGRNRNGVRLGEQPRGRERESEGREKKKKD